MQPSIAPDSKQQNPQTHYRGQIIPFIHFFITANVKTHPLLQII